TTGSWIQAKLASRFPTERFVQAGLVVVIAGLASFMVVLHPEVSPWLAVPTFGLAGLGMGLAYAPTTLIVLRETPPAEQGSTTAAVSLSDSLGTALGIGVTGAIVAASVRTTGLTVDGLVIGFACCIAVGLGGLVLSTRLRVPHPHPAAAVGMTDAARSGASCPASRQARCRADTARRCGRLRGRHATCRQRPR